MSGLSFRARGGRCRIEPVDRLPRLRGGHRYRRGLRPRGAGGPRGRALPAPAESEDPPPRDPRSHRALPVRRARGVAPGGRLVGAAVLPRHRAAARPRAGPRRRHSRPARALGGPVDPDLRLRACGTGIDAIAGGPIARSGSRSRSRSSSWSWAGSPSRFTPPAQCSRPAPGSSISARPCPLRWRSSNSRSSPREWWSSPPSVMSAERWSTGSKGSSTAGGARPGAASRDRSSSRGCRSPSWRRA